MFACWYCHPFTVLLKFSKIFWKVTWDYCFFSMLKCLETLELRLESIIMCSPLKIWSNILYFLSNIWPEILKHEGFDIVWEQDKRMAWCGIGISFQPFLFEAGQQSLDPGILHIIIVICLVPGFTAIITLYQELNLWYNHFKFLQICPQVLDFFLLSFFLLLRTLNSISRAIAHPSVLFVNSFGESFNLPFMWHSNMLWHLQYIKACC